MVLAVVQTVGNNSKDITTSNNRCTETITVNNKYEPNLPTSTTIAITSSNRNSISSVFNDPNYRSPWIVNRNSSQRYIDPNFN